MLHEVVSVISSETIFFIQLSLTSSSEKDRCVFHQIQRVFIRIKHEQRRQDFRLILILLGGVKVIERRLGELESSSFSRLFSDFNLVVLFHALKPLFR